MKYHVSRIDFEDHVDRIVDMMRENLDSPELDAERLRRDYCNAQYPARLHGLFDEQEELVGLMVIKPMPWTRSGRELDAVVLGDWSVDARHRTLFPAMKLARDTVNGAVDEHHVLIGFPNPAAEPVFRRAASEASLLGGMRRFARPLNLFAMLAMRAPAVGFVLRPLAWLEGMMRRGLACLRVRDLSLQLVPVDASGPLTELAPLEGVFRKEIDEAFLQWRFAGVNPGRYRLLEMSDAKERRARAVLEPEDGVIHVRDLVWEPGFPLERLPLVVTCLYAPRARVLSISLFENQLARDVARRMGMQAREINRPFYVISRDTEGAMDPEHWLVTDGCEDR